MSCFLIGKSTCLRALEPSDVQTFSHWFADRDVVRYSMTTWQYPLSEVETAEWLEKTIRDKLTLSLGIVETATKKLIGYAGISGVSLINRSGEFYIFIGEKTAWGKGYGTEVTRMIVAYGFDSLNLNRIMLTVSAINGAGVTAYVKAGFKQEGVLRQASYRDGAFHDKLIMSILKEEWESEGP